MIVNNYLIYPSWNYFDFDNIMSLEMLKLNKDLADVKYHFEDCCWNPAFNSAGFT